MSDEDRCYQSTTASVRALTPSEGRVEWVTRVESAGVGVAVGEGILLAPTTDGTVLALDPATGDARWRVTLDSTPTTPPRLTSDAAVVGTETGVTVLARDGGDRCLTANTRGPVTDLAVDGHRAYAAVSSEPVGSVVAVNVATERVAFDRFLTAPPRKVAVADGRLYASTEAKLTVADATTGEFVWRRDGDPSAFVVDEHLVVATGQTLLAFDDESGVEWRERYDAGSISGLARAGQHLFVTGTDPARALAVVDATTGQTRVEVQSATAFGEPTVAHDRVFVTTADDVRAFEEVAQVLGRTRQQRG